MKRPLAIAVFLALALGIAGLGFAFRSKVSVAPAVAPAGIAPSPTIDRDTAADPEDSSRDEESGDAGSDAEAIERIMSEIEQTATGDEDVLESEYAAESERFMDGAVVMEQLGTSYDETSY